MSRARVRRRWPGTSRGIEVLVVTLTGGERGSVLNPKLDVPEVHANISQIRRDEMDRAIEILGVQHVWFGFVDSGLPEGDPLPELPEGCCPSVARGRGRATRSAGPRISTASPTTYDENGGYPHPDHIMCHRVSVEAFEAAGDPARYPGTGQPWEPLKLLPHDLRQASGSRAARRHGRDGAGFAVRGVACRLGRPSEEKDRVTTRVDCALVPGARRRVARSPLKSIRMAAGSPFPSMRRAGCGRPRITSSHGHASTRRCPRTTSSLQRQGTMSP